MTLLVGVPDDRMREEPRGRDAEVVVWRPGDPPLDRVFDLLVLPYMMPSAELARLAGQPARVLQAQMLGWDGVADHLPPGYLYCNAVGVHETPTAELAVGLMIAARRGLPRAVLAQSAGEWRHERSPGLALSRVLLIGAGGVGSRIAELLDPFGVELTRVARTEREDARGRVHGLDRLADLLPDQDVVVVAMRIREGLRLEWTFHILEKTKARMELSHTRMYTPLGVYM